MSKATEIPQGPVLPKANGLYVSFMRTLREQRPASFLLVFLSILVALKGNQYLFFNFETSPAVLLMPTGIGLAAIYLGGYRLWVPIACAWLLSLITSPSNPAPLFIAAATIAHPLQAVIGGYVLHRFNFLGTLGRTRCAIVLIMVALFLPVVAPTITTGVQLLTNSLSAPLWTTWSRA